MNIELAEKLLKMAQIDESVRSDLLERGVLSDGYHPEMEQVHNENSKELQKIIKKHGWPSKAIVGDQAAYAAWIIVQHAISQPEFQRSSLIKLKEEMIKNTIDPSWVAMLEDRIKVFEGNPQTYGTQFDWDEDGQLSPLPIAEPQKVDSLRRSVGLSPMSEKIEKIRTRAKINNENPPRNPAEKKKKYLEWLSKVGWRI